MSQSIEAMMGLLPPDDMIQQRALADQLRGKEQMGQFFSLSPTLSGYGQNMQGNALKAAQQAGDRRQQGLTRTRQAEQDRIAEEERQRKYQGFTDIKQYTNPDTKKVETWGRNKSTGNYEQIPEMAGLTEYTDPDTGKNTWSSELSTGEKVLVHRNGSVTIPGRGTFIDMSDAEANSLERMARGEANITAAKDWAEFDAAEAGDKITSLVELDGAMGASLPTLDQIVAAVDSKATSGVIYDLIPSFTDATKYLESAKARMTLAGLQKYKLTPVSDKDLAELRAEAVPNLTPDQLKSWALHKKEAYKRAMKANRVMEDYIREKRRIPQNEQERAALKAQMDDIKYGDGFDFTWSPTGGIFNPEKPTKDENQTDTTGSVTKNPAPVSDEGWTVIENK